MYVTLYKDEIELQSFRVFDEDYMTYAILCDIWQSEGRMKVIVKNKKGMESALPPTSEEVGLTAQYNEN